MKRYLYIILLSLFCSVACVNGGGNNGDDDDDAPTYDKVCDNIVGGDYEDCGDFYKTDAKNWLVELYTADYSEIVRLEIQTPITATSFVGDYSINNSREAQSAVSGYLDDEVPCGCCWVRYGSNGGFAECLLFVSGRISIIKTNGVYSIALEAITSNGKKVCLYYNGEMSSWGRSDKGISMRVALRDLCLAEL